MTKVLVNRDKCAGIGLCEMSAPNVIEVGEDGQAATLLDEIPDEDMAGVEEAVSNCPTEALTIEQ